MSILKAKTSIDFNWFFKFFVSHNNCTLLSTNNKFTCCLRTVFESGRSYNNFLSLWIIISNLKRLNSIFFEFSSIPEMSKTISRNRNTLKASLSHLPLEMSDRIMMWLLNVSQSNRLSSFTIIPNTYNTICTPTANYISQFMIERQICYRWRRLERNLRSVWIL
jgi:hypothetical protein